MKRIVKTLLLVALLAAISVGAVLIYQGYGAYQHLIKEHPLDE